jgi:hypothetical protein
MWHPSLPLGDKGLAGLYFYTDVLISDYFTIIFSLQHVSAAII